MQLKEEQKNLEESNGDKTQMMATAEISSNYEDGRELTLKEIPWKQMEWF